LIELTVKNFAALSSTLKHST